MKSQSFITKFNACTKNGATISVEGGIIAAGRVTIAGMISAPLTMDTCPVRTFTTNGAQVQGPTTVAMGDPTSAAVPTNLARNGVAPVVLRLITAPRKAVPPIGRARRARRSAPVSMKPRRMPRMIMPRRREMQNRSRKARQ